MADRRPGGSRGFGGYLGRLVEPTAHPRTSALQLPRQPSWGPTRPAAAESPLESPHESGAAEFAPSDARTPARPRRPAPPARAERSSPGSAELGPSIPPPGSGPVRSTRPSARAVPGTRPATGPGIGPGMGPGADRPAPEPASPRMNPPTVRQPSSSAPQPVSVRPSGPPRGEPVGQPAVTAAAAPLSPTVAHALERLAARSLPLPAADDPNVGGPRVHARKRPPNTVPPPARQASIPAPAAPRPRRQMPREHRVNIGTIEVTIASPPPPPAPPPQPPVRRIVSAPARVGRLSRPLPGYGLGQG